MPTTPSTTKIFTIGLKSLKSALKVNTGLMPSDDALLQHGNVYRDTLTFETADPTKEEYFEEEVDLAAATFYTAGETTINFEILRPSVADLKYWAGGDAAGNNGEIWKAPTSYKNQELAIRLVSKQGYVIDLPRVMVTASPTGGGAKSTPLRLKVSGTVLVPSDTTGATAVDMPPIILDGTNPTPTA